MSEHLKDSLHLYFVRTFIQSSTKVWNNLKSKLVQNPELQKKKHLKDSIR